MEPIRNLTASDVPSLMHLKDSAGWNQTEEDWLRLIRLQPDGCFGIEIDGAVVASATAMCYGDELAWIGMVLTLPEFRGRGFARALVQQTMEIAGSREIRLDASDMGLPLYESLGFVEECPIERWSREGIGRVGGVLCGSGEIDYDLDREAFGADRSALLQDLSGIGYLANQYGHIFARPGADTRYLGPCVSRDPESARELIESAISGDAGSLCADLFPTHPHMPALARQLGFRPVRRLTRMVRRPSLVKPPDERIYLIAGFEFG